MSLQWLLYARLDPTASTFPFQCSMAVTPAPVLAMRCRSSATRSGSAECTFSHFLELKASEWVWMASYCEGGPSALRRPGIVFTAWRSGGCDALRWKTVKDVCGGHRGYLNAPDCHDPGRDRVTRVRTSTERQPCQGHMTHRTLYDLLCSRTQSTEHHRALQSFTSI